MARKNPYPSVFFENLTALLKKISWTQKRLAKEIEVTEYTVSRWWDDPPGEKSSSISKICSVTGCSKDYLEGKSDKMFSELKSTYLNQLAKGSNTEFNIEEIHPQMIRQYRTIAKMDQDTFGEIQTWVNDIEKIRPGFTSWFREEFQNRFPEFGDWKEKITKNYQTGTDN